MMFRAAGYFVLCALGGAAVAGDWPQWRGLNRDGVSTETINTNWGTEGPKVVWRALVGTGFSSVAVSEGRAYTAGNNTNEDVVSCFRAKTGQVLWRHSYPARLDPQWYEGGPGATPTVDGGHVFTISKWGDVFCFDAKSGAIIWQRNLRQDGLKPNRWGFAGSPLIWKKLVIFNAGSSGLALDRVTGQIAWCNGTNAAGYASPTLYTVNGRPTLLIFAAKHLVALDPQTGKELWRHFWETGWDTNITDPIFWRGDILISSFSRGCALLRVDGAVPQLLYDSKVLHNHLSPGIVIGDDLYAFNGEAKTDTDFCCLSLPDGQKRWSRKDPAFGSLIRAGELLLLLSTKGELIAAKPSPEGLEILARASVLTGTCWTPPALANGLLYVRNAKGELRCLDLKPH